MSVVLDIIAGGPGHEAAVSRDSAAGILAAARAAGMDAIVIDIGERLEPERLRPDSIVFDIVHGTYGEDGTLQAELEELGRSYIGSDAAVSRLCMDKQATRERLATAQLPVPWGVVLDPSRPVDLRALCLPDLCGYVLKPRSDGSSVGVRLLDNPGQLLPTLQELVVELGPVPLLLERRLRGAEYTVGLIDDGAGGWRALPPIRIGAGGVFYDYAAKYTREDTAYDFDLPAGLADELSRLARAAVTSCGCRDLARVDLMSDGEALHLLEVNTLPGFTGHSLLPKAAERAGIAYPELITILVDCARRRMEED